MKKFKIHLLNILFLVFLTYSLTAETTDNSIDDQVYRYTNKIKFKKVKAGENLQFIYCPLPRNNDYQLISNIDTHSGEILDNPDSPDNYVRFTISPEQQPAEGDWGEVMIEFDYVPSNTEYVSANIDRIYEYDTTSDIYKRYTKQYYDIIDIENATIKKISDELWIDATDVYAYAKKCFDYVNDNLTFKSTSGYGKTTLEILKNEGGDCGGLSTVLLSLLRCKNIPARHVFAYRHAWGEFYLENYGWIPVDPTFKTFGRIVEGYGLIRSHEIVYNIEVLNNNKTGRGRVDILSKTHLFYPSHDPYICDLEVEQKPIVNRKI